MRHLLIFITFLVTHIFFGQSQPTKSIDYYETGTIEIIEYMQNGERTGIRKEFHDNGKLREVSNYKKGRPIGECRIYYYNGQLKSVEYFEDAKNSSPTNIGVRREYHPNGQLKLIEQFGPKGIHIGRFISYHDNGNINRIGTYKADAFHGIWTSYYENGVIWSREKFRNGYSVGTHKIFYPNGQLKKKYHYKYKDLRSGKWITYSENGEILSIERYKKGKLITSKNQ